MDDRIYQGDDNAWYYHVRGHQVMGPFETLGDAEKSLAKQLKQWGANPKPKRTRRPFGIFRRSASRQR